MSDISAEDAADAESDVSSLNELEKFDFERDTRESASNTMIEKLPGARSGSVINNGSPVFESGYYERPWR